MSNDFSRFVEKLDGQISKKKLEKALTMLKTESPNELKKKLSNVNINELLSKMDEYDKKKFRELGIDLNDIKRNISQEDLNKISKVLGSDADKVIKKINDILRN